MVWFLTKVIAPIAVLGILVVVHEFGHFIVAKLCRVGVLKFAVGFGPAIIRTRRHETTYQIGAIPLGGFVRMVGDMPDLITGAQPTDEIVRDDAGPTAPAARLLDADEENDPAVLAVLHDRSRWFVEKNLWQRSAVVFAGPLFNFLFATFVIFCCVLLYGVRTGMPPMIGGIIAGSPAEKAGLRGGDLVQTLNQTPVSSWEELALGIQQSGGKPVSLKVLRDGALVDLTAEPQAKVRAGAGGERVTTFMIGIDHPNVYEHKAVSVTEAAQIACMSVYETTSGTLFGIVNMLRGLIPADDLASPIYIFQTTGQRAKQGLEELLYLAAFLSVSLAVLNLLPIPILDGGHLLFFFLEAVLGPISVRKKEVAQQVGLLLLLGLMVFAVKNDIFRKAPVDDQPAKSWDSLGEPAKGQP